jgi:hypothetical protein
MTVVDLWMDIFKPLYVEWVKPAAIAAALNRAPSSITRETAQGVDKGMYNPIITGAGRPKKSAPSP